MAIDFNSLVIGPCVGIFGEAVQYTSQAGTFAITGVFNESYLEIAPLGRGGMASESMNWGFQGAVSGEMSVLGVQLSQFLAEPAQGDLLVVRGTTFVLKEVRPDGQGGAQLLLNQYSD